MVTFKQFLNEEKWKQVGIQLGSNPGGTYEDASGIKHYVKFYDNLNQAKNEHLANLIYKELGINVPETKLITVNGKEAIASRLVNRPTYLNQKAIKNHEHVRSGFVADAYLANHDVIGMDYDNIVGSNGKAYRIDNGGALFFRAQGAPKTSFKHDSIPELQSMKNIGTAGEMYNDIKDEETQIQAKHLIKTLHDKKINELVDSVGFDDKTANDYKKHLIGRRNALKRKVW